MSYLHSLGRTHNGRHSVTGGLDIIRREQLS